jgi:hypothetical protein
MDILFQFITHTLPSKLRSCSWITCTSYMDYLRPSFRIVTQSSLATCGWSSSGWLIQSYSWAQPTTLRRTGRLNASTSVWKDSYDAPSILVPDNGVSGYLSLNFVQYGLPFCLGKISVWGVVWAQPSTFGKWEVAAKFSSWSGSMDEGERVTVQNHSAVAWACPAEDEVASR